MSKRKAKPSHFSSTAAMKMKMPQLPKELTEEILSRVPATNLKRLRSTCKWWGHLIKDDKSFAKKHSEKAPKEFLVLLLSIDKTVCSMNVNLQRRRRSLLIKHEVSLVESPTFYAPTQIFHCDGLLLCTSVYESTIVVWNPLTRQTRRIEAGDGRGQTFVLGYYYREDYTKCYKILGFKSGVQGWRMYEFESGLWRVSLDDIAPGWNNNIGYDSTQAVSLEGKAYLLFAREETEMQTGVSLLSFDFSTEKFVPVRLPYQCDRYKTVAISVVKEEKLSVLLQRENASETEVWVTSKTNVVSWTKLLALTLSPDLPVPSLSSFLLYEEKKVVVWFQQWEVVDDDENEDDYEDGVKYVVYIVGEDNKVHQVLDLKDNTLGETCSPTILNYVPRLDQLIL